MSRPIISPCGSEVSLRSLQRPSSERPSSPETLENGPIEENFRNTRKPAGYVQVASQQDMEAEASEAEDRDDEGPTAATSRQSTFGIWILEFLSIFLAFSSLAAIIITLSIHQGQPVPEWPSFVSINALVAVFSAILKAAMVMPVAEGS